MEPKTTSIKHTIACSEADIQSSCTKTYPSPTLHKSLKRDNTYNFFIDHRRAYLYRITQD